MTVRGNPAAIVDTKSGGERDISAERAGGINEVVQVAHPPILIYERSARERCAGELTADANSRSTALLTRESERSSDREYSRGSTQSERAAFERRKSRDEANEKTNR